jgi:NADPH-dependent curcumin reductase CurA
MCWKVDPSLCPTPSAALSVLGMTGLPAYFGLLDIGKPKPGETVLVSAAAGAVGSIVGQIAKIKGCRAVGIAGGAEKCRRLIEEFGFDAAVDYKGKDSAQLSAAIKEACPDGVDIYFDNVGGTVLDAALLQMNWQGRVPVCGMISGYDGGNAPQMHNLFLIVAKVLHVQGFLSFTYEDRFQEAIAELSGWIAEGRIKYRDEVFEGLEQAIPTFMRLFDGSNQGKTMVKL